MVNDWLRRKCGRVLLLIVFIASISDTAVGAYSKTIDGVTWHYNDCGNVVEIASLDGSGDIRVPSHLEVQRTKTDNDGNTAYFTVNLPVVRILPNAFGGRDGITSAIIPEQVSEVGENAFNSCVGLTNVAIRSGSTRILPNAFSGCTSLDNEDGVYYDSPSRRIILWSDASEVRGELIIPGSVEMLADSVFGNCPELKSVHIPGSVPSISDSAFAGCTSLRSATIEEGVAKISDRAFEGCANLQTVEIPESVAHMGQSVFSGCTSLGSVDFRGRTDAVAAETFAGCTGVTNIVFSAGVKHIGAFAFRGFANLRTVTLPDGLVGIGEAAFAGCTGLTSIRIPGGIARIPDMAFMECAGLTDVVMEEGVREIGRAAFMGCRELKTMQLPESVDVIQPEAFAACVALPNLQGVFYDSEAWRWVLWGDAGAIEGDLVLPETVKGISNAAFGNCSNLCSIVVGNGVEMIGADAFSGCGAMTNMVLPFAGNRRAEAGDRGENDEAGRFKFGWIFGRTVHDGWVEGGGYRYPGNLESVKITDQAIVTQSAFEGCVTLKRIEFEHGVREIGYGAFAGCTSLTGMAVPDSVQAMGGSAFRGCLSMEWIMLPFVGEGRGYSSAYCYDVCCNEIYNVEDIFAWIFDGTDDYAGFYYDGIWHPVQTVPAALKRVEITDASGLGPRAFSGCMDLEELTIGGTVAEISAGAFGGCRSLKYIKLPQTFRVVDENLFAGLWSLETLVLPDEIESIGRGAFYGCRSLAELTIGGSVAEIEGGTFGGCHSLKRIKLPETLRTVDDGLFAGLSSLETVVLPDGIEAIGRRAFQGCAQLKTFVIPEGTASLGERAFEGCGSLMEVRIPGSVATIGDGAFQGCAELREIEIPEGVKVMGAGVFEGCGNLERIKLPGTLATVGGALRTGDAAMADLQEFTVPTGCLIADADGKRPATVAELFPDSHRTIRNAAIPEGTRVIPANAFAGCMNLESVRIPSSVAKIENGAFAECYALEKVVFGGDAPVAEGEAFADAPIRMMVEAPEGSIGWGGGMGEELPELWGGRRIAHAASGGTAEGETSESGTEAGGGGTEEGSGPVSVNLTVTNVVVHYVRTASIANSVAPVTQSTGIVAVMTEVKGGNFAVPDTWAENFPGFREKFGANFGKAMTMPTGKTDAAGNPLMVWHDFVCGTDPMDKDDVFRASITIADGVPQVSYTPELPAGQAALRKYTLWGKERLADEGWTEVAEGETGRYNFFKVTVEMRGM